MGATCSPELGIGEVHEPALAPGVDGIAFFELRDASGSKIFRARLATRLLWIADPAKAVLGDASASFGAPTALVSGARVDLWVMRSDGSAIEHASSTDGGVSFTLDAAPVLVPKDGWEMGSVGSPSAFEKAGHRYLAYEGGAGAGIGIAELAAGGGKRIGSQPIATPRAVEDPVFWRGVTRVGTPSAVVDDADVRVYVTARGAEGGDAVALDGPIPAERNDSIGLVTTVDLVHVERYPTGPVLARVANLRTYLGEREPAVRVSPDGAELFFVASDAAGAVAGLARAGF